MKNATQKASRLELPVIPPFYNDELITLYNTDYKKLDSLPPIQAVITDSPFNAGKDFANDRLDEKDFRAFCNEFVLYLYKLKPQNILIEVGKNDKIMRQEMERYFEYEYAISLNYTNSMRNGKIGYSNWGMVLWFSNNGKCYNRYKDRIDSELHNTKNDFEHPSPKEVDHYKWLVKMFTEEGGVVFDPFAGSGTTLLASRIVGRKAVGCEIDFNYCKIITKRLSQIEMPFSAEAV